MTVEGVLAARLEAAARREARTLRRWCALLGGGVEGMIEVSTTLVDKLSGEEGPRTRARLVTDGILSVTPDPEPRWRSRTLPSPAWRAPIDPTALPAMHARIADCLDGTPAAQGEGAAAPGASPRGLG